MAANKPRLTPARYRLAEAHYQVAKTQLRHSASFLDFVRDAWPIVEPGAQLVEGWALHALCAHLEAVTYGRIRYLLITVPPGLMKSLLLNVFWPAWEWGPLNRPHLKVLGVSYKQAHTKRDGRRMRLLVENEWYRRLYGRRVTLTTQADEDFETSALGWRRSRTSVSVTGERCDRLNLDDVHNASTIESEAARAAVVLNVRENILNRVNDATSTPVVLIMQRLHETDIAGVILRDNLGFEHLNLPMRFDPERRCSTSIGFTDRRTQPGESLFPERFPEDELKRMEHNMAPYSWAAQYQQDPISRAGTMFKRANLVLTDSPPPSRFKARVCAWDLAATEAIGGKDPDYTVAVVAGIDDGNGIHILQVYRFRLEAAARNALIREIADLWGREVRQHFPIDPGQAGKDQQDYLRRLLDLHYDIAFTRPIASKGERAHRAVVATQLNRVIIHAFPQRDAFIDEICAFPGGRHEDQVDAFADAVRELETMSTSGYDWNVAGGSL